MNIIIDALHDAGAPVVAGETVGENDSSWHEAFGRMSRGSVPKANFTAHLAGMSADDLFELVARIYELLGMKSTRIETHHDREFSRAKLRIDGRRESAVVIILQEGSFFSIGTFCQPA